MLGVRKKRKEGLIHLYCSIGVKLSFHSLYCYMDLSFVEYILTLATKNPTVEDTRNHESLSLELLNFKTFFICYAVSLTTIAISGVTELYD